MPTTIPARILLRRGTASEWASANPVLAAGEPGVTTDTNEIFVGDGVTAYSSLPKFAADASNFTDINVSGTTDTDYLRVGVALSNLGATGPRAVIAWADPGQEFTYNAVTELILARGSTVAMTLATDAQGTGQINFADVAAEGSGQIRYAHGATDADDTMDFRVGGSDRLSIQAAHAYFYAAVYSQGNYPNFNWIETDGPSTNNRTEVAVSSGNLIFSTRDTNDLLVSTDYRMEKGASGVTNHRWYINNSLTMDLDAGQLKVDDRVRIEGGAPELHFYDTGEAADEKLWRFATLNGNLYLQTQTDANTVGEAVWTGFRGTGTAVTEQHFYVGNTEIVSLTTSGLQLKNSGARVDTIETTLTDDDTHIPTSGAVVDYVAANQTPNGVTGKTWTDVSGLRSPETTYQNTSGEPLYVAISVTITSGTTGCALYVHTSSAGIVDGAYALEFGSPETDRYAIVAVIPEGHYYRVDQFGGTGGITLSTWKELQ